MTRAAPWWERALLRMPGGHRLAAAIKTRVYPARASEYHRRLSAPVGVPGVCILLNAGIGNAVEATPLVQALRTVWPRAHLTLVTPWADLFDSWPAVNAVVPAADSAAFDHTFVPWTAHLPDSDTVEWGLVHGLDRPVGGPFLTHERDMNMRLAREVGYVGAIPPPCVTLRKPAVVLPAAPVRIALAAGGNPGREWERKRWPHWGQWVRMVLDAHSDAHIRVIGAADDDVPGLPGDDRVLDLRGRLSLAETAWVLRQSDVAVGNDCGPMHIADAVQTPTVVLFGPTSEVKNGPSGPGRVLHSDISCRPCQFTDLWYTCDDPQCMIRLSPEHVMTEVAMILQHRTGLR